MKKITLFAVLTLMLVSFCACSQTADTSKTNEKSTVSEVSGGVSEEASENSEESTESSFDEENDGESYVEVNDSKDGVIDYLVTDAWQEFGEGNALGEKPGDREAPPDEKPSGNDPAGDRWYFNSSLWFERDNTARLTAKDEEIDCTYQINDDFTITLFIPGGNGIFDEEKTIDFSLVSSNKYGIVLSSVNGSEHIRYYAARI